MRVLCCPAAFGFDAGSAATAMTAGWLDGAAHDVAVAHPVDVEALVDSVAAARPDVARVRVEVAGPDGAPVPADLLVLPQAPDGGRPTVIVDATQACGRAADWPLESHPPDPDRPDELWRRLTSRGVGDVLLAAARQRPARIVVGVGPAASHDGGAGLLDALGVRAGDPESLRRARARFAGCRLIAATTDQLPLLGLSGASAALVHGRGLDPATAQTLEADLGRFAHEAQAALGPVARDLLSPNRSRLAHLPGSGAGGGVGFALALLGAELTPAPAVLAELSGLPAAIADADLIVTGAASFDWRELRESMTSQITELALAAGRPVIVVAGRVDVGRREATSLGVEATYAVRDDRDSRPISPADLRARVARLARTWSRGPSAAGR